MMAKLTENSLKSYRRALAPFTEWLVAESCFQREGWEWDNALADYKHEKEEELTHSKFSTLISAVEFFLPRLKGELGVSHAIVNGWRISHTARHTVPMGFAAASVAACFLAVAGKPRLALGLLLQSRTGMRPGEMLALRREDLSFPEDRGEAAGNLIVALGARTGTKVKRPQVTMVSETSEPELVALMACLRQMTSSGRLFPHSRKELADELRSLEGKLSLTVGWTPHSPRAGFASDLRAAGWSFSEVREAGRWQADSSLRTYLDIVQASQIAVTVQAQGLGPWFAFGHARWHTYVAAGLGLRDAGDGIPQDQRRVGPDHTRGPEHRRRGDQQLLGNAQLRFGQRQRSHPSSQVRGAEGTAGDSASSDAEETPDGAASSPDQPTQSTWRTRGASALAGFRAEGGGGTQRL